MAGVCIGWAPLFAWAAATIRRQVVLVYSLAVPIFLGGVGRLVSFAQDGMPSPAGGFLTSALLELVLPIVIVWTHSTALRPRRVPTAARGADQGVRPGRRLRRRCVVDRKELWEK
jgi:hypothetical protein